MVAHSSAQLLNRPISLPIKQICGPAKCYNPIQRLARNFQPFGRDEIVGLTRKSAPASERLVDVRRAGGGILYRLLLSFLIEEGIDRFLKLLLCHGPDRASI